MLARRIIAVSPDKAFGKLMSVALKAAGGSVETHASLADLGRSEIDAALVVLHLESGVASALVELLPRLIGDAKVIAILPRANLAATVDLMQASERVAAVVAAEGLTSPELAALATRVLAGDIFGLEKLMPWGTRIHSTVVGDYQEKSLAIAQLSEFAEMMGVRRKYRESIEQCVDELLMNALYDAPVDEEGRPIFSEIPTKTRISLRVEQKVVVQYACDGVRFGVSVRDAFGTLERSTVLRYLYKCLHSEQQIDRKTGGAGLGLYLIANASSQLLFNVLPGVATEAVSVCDLESPKIQLAEFGFSNERIDASGRLAAGPSRRLPAGASFPVERRANTSDVVRAGPSRAVIGLLAALVVVMLAMIAVVAYPRFFPDTTRVTFKTDPPGALVSIDGRARGVAQGGTLTVDDLAVGKAIAVRASLDGYEPAETVVEPADRTPTVTLVLQPRSASVELETDPAGATVVIGDKEYGQTPVTVTTLPAGTVVEVAFTKNGYSTVKQEVAVPPPGKSARLVVPLSLGSDFASVRIESDPPGAKVYKGGELLASVTTPTEEIMVEAGKPTQFVLRLDGHVAHTLETRPERGSRKNLLTAKLVKGVAVTFAANVEGRFTVDGAPSCRRVTASEGACVLKPGLYTVGFEGEHGAHATERIDTRKGPAKVSVEFGFVEGKDGKKFKLSPGGPALTRAALRPGKRTVHVIGEGGETEPAQVEVKAGKTSTLP